MVCFCGGGCSLIYPFLAQLSACSVPEAGQRRRSTALEHSSISMVQVHQGCSQATKVTSLDTTTRCTISSQLWAPTHRSSCLWGAYIPVGHSSLVLRQFRIKQILQPEYSNISTIKDTELITIRNLRGKRNTAHWRISPFITPPPQLLTHACVSFAIAIRHQGGGGES